MSWCIHGLTHKIHAEREQSVARLVLHCLSLSLYVLLTLSHFVLTAKVLCNDGTGQEEMDKKRWTIELLMAPWRKTHKHHFFSNDMLFIILRTKKGTLELIVAPSKTTHKHHIIFYDMLIFITYTQKGTQKPMYVGES
jgi:hypothetical protein